MAKPAHTTDRTERLGVNAVERLVTRDLGWIFREQHIGDYGIDAIVEARDESGRPTGRMLALQIKAGPHTQRRPRAAGWRYPVKARHERYWRHHALPVLLVLVDIETEQAWWEQANASTLRTSGKNFSLLVPQAQSVADAVEPWNHLASARYAEAQVRYPDVLSHLPPATSRWLRSLAEGHRDDAAVLAAHLAEARSVTCTAAQLVTALLEAPPPYLNHSMAWRVLGVFAAEHQLHQLSAAALERAAEDPGVRARMLGAAALQLHMFDDVRAQQLCAEALIIDSGEPRALVARVALAHGATPGAVRLLPGVDLSTERALADPSVQALLAVMAQRQGDRHRDVEHRQRASDLAPEDGGHQLELANALLRRSQSRDAQRSDLPRAVVLLEGVVADLHRWGGPTEQPLGQLLTALGLHLDWAGVLRWARPAPQGRATPQEAMRPPVLRLAFEAAENLGDITLARELAPHLRTSGPEGLRRSQALGEVVSRDDVVRVWGEQLAGAEVDGDDAALLVAAFHLAEEGVDESRRLDEAVRSGAIAKTARELVGVVALAAQDLESALPALRELADRDPTAAERLVVALDDAGRTEEAILVARRAESRLRQPALGLLVVDVLLRAGRKEDAAAAARDALATGDHAGLGAARLHDLLGTGQAACDDWAGAERHFQRAVEAISPPRPWRVWNLVLCQLRQHEPRRAAATLRTHPAAVIDAPSARMWLEAHQGEEWDADLAGTALVLAESFPTDDQLVEALLGQVVLATQGTPPPHLSSSSIDADSDADESTDTRPVVPGELHRRAFEMINRHLERREGHSRSGFAMMSGSPEELSARVRTMARQRHEALRGVDEEAVRDGRLPLGFVASVAGWSPALAVAARAAGVHVAVSDVEVEHDAEVLAADAALGGTVVVDASSLHLPQLLPGPARLAGRFAELRMPEATRQDILRALSDARQSRGNAGTLVWDSDRGDLVIHRDDPERVEQVVAYCEELVSAAHSTTSVPVPALTFLKAGDGATELDHDCGHDPVDAAWAAPVQLALDELHPLWSDDLVVRRLAKETGTPAFGTVALLEALCRRAIAEVPETEDAARRLDEVLDGFRNDIRGLASAGVVDLPLHSEDFLALAEAEEWQHGAAIVALSRASTWQSPGAALLIVDALLGRVANQRPDRLETWARAAMAGAATALTYEAEGRALVLAIIAELGGGEQLLAVASAVAHERGLPDPTTTGARARRLVHVLRTGGVPEAT